MTMRPGGQIKSDQCFRECLSPRADLSRAPRRFKLSRCIYHSFLAFSAVPIAEKFRGTPLGSHRQKVVGCNSATHGGWTDFEVQPGGVRVAFEHYCTFTNPQTMYLSTPYRNHFLPRSFFVFGPCPAFLAAIDAPWRFLFVVVRGQTAVIWIGKENTGTAEATASAAVTTGVIARILRRWHFGERGFRSGNIGGQYVP